MLYTPHAITGATIAYYLPNPFIAVPLAILSHLFFDVFPHSNPSPAKAKGVQKALIWGEFLVGNVILILYSYILSGTSANPAFLMSLMIISGISANIPDILTGFHIMLGKDWFYSKKIGDFQKLIQNHISGKYGYTLQLLLISTLIYITMFV